MLNVVIPVSDGNVCHLTVHIIFGFDQFTSVNFACVCFTSDDVTFSLVQNFDWYTNGHFYDLVMYQKGKMG
jgi:hypothetical protein